MNTTSENSKSIWLVNLFFGIGPAPTGVQLESVASQLQQEGWDVRVLTGNAGYNRATAVDPAQPAVPFTLQVNVFNCGPWNSQGRIGRLMTWLCFYLRVGLYACFRRLPDVVLLMTTPPFLCWLFAWRNRFARRKAVLVMWNQDTFPEILAAVNILSESSFLYRLLAKIEHSGVSAMDHVIVLDEAMQERLIAQGARQTSVIPNWEIALPPAKPTTSSTALKALVQSRQRFAYRVLYTGNYGWGHDLAGLWEFLREHPQQRDFYFAFVGGGEKWSEPARLKQDLSLDCLSVFDYVPKTHVHELISEADFGLVSLEAKAAGLMSPSKLHGYLALGKPVLHVGPATSNVGYALETYRCGLQVDPGDMQGFTKLFGEICNDRFDYQTLSEYARNAYDALYCERVGTQALAKLLTRQVDSNFTPRKHSHNSTTID